MKRLWTVLACLLFVTSVSPATDAAGQTASAGAAEINSESYLFPSTQLGAGWSQAGQRRQAVANSDPWESGTVRVYAGPLGARVIAMAYVVKPTRAARVAAEEAIDELAFLYEYYLFSGVNQVSDVPPVAGCDSSWRIQGMDDVVYRGGFASCTIGLEVVLIAVTSGSVLHLDGFNASAAVIGLMIKSGTQVGSPIAMPG